MPPNHAPKVTATTDARAAPTRKKRWAELGSERAKPSDPLLTLGEAAAMIGVPQAALVRWRSQGTGPRYIRYSERIVRYRREDVQAFIDGCTVDHSIAEAG